MEAEASKVSAAGTKITASDIEAGRDATIVGGDQVGGDKSSTGDIKDSAVAIGEGAQASVTYIQEVPPPPTPLGAAPPVLVNFFTPVKELIRRPSTRFPREEHIENELFHLDAEYSKTADAFLHARKRCLVTGAPAAGKTSFAIGYAFNRERSQGCRTYYADLSHRPLEAWRDIFATVVSRDFQDVLFVLDNCHLAVQLVDELCLQLELNEPRSCEVMLVSRSISRQTHEIIEEKPSRYLSDWEDVMIHVESEHIFRDVIQLHWKYAQKTPGNRCIQPQDGEWSMLEQQHSHDLAASRNRLDVWTDLGGLLSDISEEHIYRNLIQNYLVVAAETMITLCCLWQYEVPAHSVTMDKLIRSFEDDLKYLEENNVVFRVLQQDYGVMYQPSIHPQEARQIFHAGIYRKWGDVKDHTVGTYTIDRLGHYLSENPSNYLAVYNGLYQAGRKSLENRLLNLQEVQEATLASLAFGRVTDSAKYLFHLYTQDPLRAQEALTSYLEGIGIANYAELLLESGLHETQFSLHYLSRISLESARNVYRLLDINRVAKQAAESDLDEVGWVLNTLRLVDLALTKKLVNEISIPLLVDQAQSSSIHKIYRLTYQLEKLDRGFAEEFVRRLLATPMPDLTFGLYRIGTAAKYLAKFSPQFWEILDRNLFSGKQLDDWRRLFASTDLVSIGECARLRLARTSSRFNDAYEVFLSSDLPVRIRNEQLAHVNQFLRHNVTLSSLSINRKICEALSQLDLTAFPERADFRQHTWLIKLSSELGCLPRTAALKRHLEEFLRTPSITQRVQHLSVEDSSHLLSAIDSNLAPEVAKIYAQAIDEYSGNLEVESCEYVDLVWLLHFITLISGGESSKLINDPRVLQRVRQEWAESIVYSLQILGIYSVYGDYAPTDLQLLPVGHEGEEGIPKRELKRLRKNKNKFLLFYLLRGIELRDEEYAKHFVTVKIGLEAFVDYLSSAVGSAPQPVPFQDMQQLRAWSAQLLFEDTVRRADLLRQILC